MAAPEILAIVPLLPSAGIARDLEWYKEKTVFADKMYAVIKREHLYLHLQWHAGTEDDPLPGGSVIRVFVKNIQPLFDEFVKRGTVTADKFR